jgi:hypothetical protein
MMKKILCGMLAFVISVSAATYRSGWSYSGQNTFNLRETATIRVYHDPKRPFSYEDKIDDDLVFEKLVEPGKYVLTVEGYYLMEVEQ